VGTFKNDIYDGFGKLTWSDDDYFDEYIGNFSKGLYKGYGELYLKHGSVIVANWEDCYP
jgi:hypothetical protein